MATELEQALFEDELQKVQELPEASRWKLERDLDVPLGLFAVMFPAAKPDELFKARIRWNEYFCPFSLKFVNMKTGADTDPTAWPQCYGFRPASLDACLPWTAEGHALHPDWKNSVTNTFSSPELPMRFALLQLQHTLDTTFQGRWRP